MELPVWGHAARENHRSFSSEVYIPDREYPFLVGDIRRYIELVLIDPQYIGLQAGHCWLVKLSTLPSMNEAPWDF